MRPPFSLFGSKWSMARHYGPPLGRVTEPFAGSAGYSVYWDVAEVRLYDRDEAICAAWDWLTKCSVADIMAIPCPVRSNEEWLALPDGPRHLVDWNTHFARSHPSASLSKAYLHWANTGEMSKAMKSRGSTRMWDERARNRLVAQKPLMKRWTVECMDYRDIPLEDSHWFVDPPYSNERGRRYRHNRIDYEHLAAWCRGLPGSVVVCENEGADWLPFEPVGSVRSADAGRVSREVAWRKP